MITQKVLLPVCTTLERYVSRLRSRVEARLLGISMTQQARLQALLEVPEGTRQSQLNRLRTGPVMTSIISLTLALFRLNSVREMACKFFLHGFAI